MREFRKLQLVTEDRGDPPVPTPVAFVSFKDSDAGTFHIGIENPPALATLQEQVAWGVQQMVNWRKA